MAASCDGDAVNASVDDTALIPSPSGGVDFVIMYSDDRRPADGRSLQETTQANNMTSALTLLRLPLGRLLPRHAAASQTSLRGLSSLDRTSLRPASAALPMATSHHNMRTMLSPSPLSNVSSLLFPTQQQQQQTRNKSMTKAKRRKRDKIIEREQRVARGLPAKPLPPKYIDKETPFNGLVMSDRVRKLLDLTNGNQREVVSSQKRRGMELFQLREGDTGSSAVQVVALTTRIQQIQTHLAQHKKDKSGKRGLDALYVRRRKVLDYMERKDFESYRKVVKSLGLVRKGDAIKQTTNEGGVYGMKGFGLSQRCQTKLIHLQI
eukprot:scaffold1112_cov195-Alexandrium_tamarense.AAC.14